MFSALSAYFVVASAFFALGTVLLALKQVYRKSWLPIAESGAIGLGVSLVVVCTTYFYPESAQSLFSIGAGLILTVEFFRHQFKNYSHTGIFFYTTNIFLALVGVPWGAVFIISAPLSLMTKVLMLVTSPLLLFSLPFGFVQVVEQFDVLCRTHWLRPRGIKRTKPGFVPMVSLHIPTYTEPPEIVISTLNKVAELEYGNYEVLIIDNNTKDERLWRPVEAHAKKLGQKFRFYHIDKLAGAKAGALNFALAHTSPNAEIVGIIDADYHPKAGFLTDLLGHFEDLRVGFVQTPHDYRGWKGNAYLTMCYWEYKAFFHTILVALNERDAALTIGTMCLLRKQAIIEAGGWATWCVTEDSEMAIRIHDAGYSSVYVPHSYGFGLIPDRFSDYAQQRYRWIAGPVQELRHHASHILGLSGNPSALNFLQRLHHFHHGLGSTMFFLNIPLTILSIGLALSMALHHEIIGVPFPLWISVTTLFFTYFVLQWLQYHVILKTSIRNMLLGIVANKSLSHTVNWAAFCTTINTKQLWKRTNKFKIDQKISSALLDTRTEILIGAALLIFSASLYVALPYPGLLTMCLLGIFYKSIDHLAAPAVALTAAFSQNKVYQRESDALFLQGTELVVN